MQSNLTVVLVTGAVGRFGTQALAGYGMASRLDFLLIPLMFGLGSAILTMVGTNVGAGQAARARHVAWTEAVVALIFTGIIGLGVAFAPSVWLSLFSHDPAALAVGALYLRTVRPFYGVVGMGFILYFAAQGTGRVALAFAAGSVRLLTAAGLGWLAVTYWGGGLGALFWIVALSAILFGAMTSLSTLSRSWGEHRN